MEKQILKLLLHIHVTISENKKNNEKWLKWIKFKLIIYVIEIEKNIYLNLNLISK